MADQYFVLVLSGFATCGLVIKGSLEREYRALELKYRENFKGLPLSNVVAGAECQTLRA